MPLRMNYSNNSYYCLALRTQLSRYKLITNNRILALFFWLSFLISSLFSGNPSINELIHK